MRLGYKIGIFIPFLLILLMSHNASALDLNITLNDYEQIPVNVSPNYYNFKIYNNSGTLVRTCSNATYCELVSNSQLRVTETDKTFSMKKGDIVTYNVAFYTPSGYGSMYNFGVRSLTPGANVQALYVHQVSDTTFEGSAGFNFYNSGSNPTQYEGLFSNNYNLNTIYEIALIYNADGNYKLGSFNDSTVDFTFNLGSNISTGLPRVAVYGFNHYRYNGSSVNSEQEEATQEAADESQDVADENSENEQSSNLIGILQDLLNSLTGLSATNCNVDLAFPSSLGGTMSVNICQNKDKAGTIISVFGSITLVVFYLPLAMKLLSMIYNEIRSFTNG